MPRAAAFLTIYRGLFIGGVLWGRGGPVTGKVRQGKQESRTRPSGGFRPDFPALRLHDPPTNREADSCSQGTGRYEGA